MVHPILNVFWAEIASACKLYLEGSAGSDDGPGAADEPSVGRDSDPRGKHDLFFLSGRRLLYLFSSVLSLKPLCLAGSAQRLPGIFRPFAVAPEADKAEKDLERLLKMPVEPDLTLPDGRNALQVSAHSGSTNAARLLLEARASIDSKDPRGMSILGIACETGSASVAQVVVEAGHCLDAVSPNR